MHPGQTPAWRGYASRADIDLIQKLFVKAKHWRIANIDYNLEKLLENCEKAPFVASQLSKHCLYSRFPKKDNQLHTLVLKRCGHSFALPIIKTKCASNTFINRTFFKYVLHIQYSCKYVYNIVFCRLCIIVTYILMIYVLLLMHFCNCERLSDQLNNFFTYLFTFGTIFWLKLLNASQ